MKKTGYFYKFLVLRSMYFLKVWIETDYASAGTTETKLLSSRPFLKHTVPSTNA